MTVYAWCAREWRNLADAPALGAGARKGVGVRIPPLAHQGMPDTPTGPRHGEGRVAIEQLTLSSISPFSRRSGHDRVEGFESACTPQDPEHGRQDGIHG